MIWVAFFACVLLVLHGSFAEPPAAFLIRAQNFKDPQAFIREFVDTGRLSQGQMEEINSAIRTMQTQGQEASRRANSRYAVASTNTLNDGCVPEPTAIATNEGSDPQIFTFPVCQKISRCGGCCGSATTICGPAPGGVVMRTFKVMKFSSTDFQSQNLKYLHSENKQVEEHTACQCQCKVKAENCNPAVHTYDPNNCRCKCRVRQTSCANGMIWDDSTCSCISKQTVALLTWRARSNGDQPPSFTAQAQETQRVVASSDPCENCVCGRMWKAKPMGTTCRCEHGRSGRPMPCHRPTK